MSRVYEILIEKGLLSEEKLDGLLRDFALRQRELELRSAEEGWLDPSTWRRALLASLRDDVSFGRACREQGSGETDGDSMLRERRQALWNEFEEEVARACGLSRRMLALGARGGGGPVARGQWGTRDDEPGLRGFREEVRGLLADAELRLRALDDGDPLNSHHAEIRKILQILQGAFSVVELDPELDELLRSLALRFSDLRNANVLPGEEGAQLRQGFARVREVLEMDNRVIVMLPKVSVPVPPPLIPEVPEVIAPLAVAPPVAIAERLELDPVFRDIDAGLLEDFAETFDGERHYAVEKSLLALEKMFASGAEAEPLETELANLFRDLHTLKGSSRFIAATLLEKLIHSAEDLVGFTKTFYAQMSTDERASVLRRLLETTDQAWLLRTVIVETGSEEAFWCEPASRDAFLRHLQALIELKSALEKKGYSLSLDAVKSLF